ncbi:MAG: winged helix-turn-helix transcriptional regulator [Candidatus Nomurabacteria bacterium]|nr:MAG: winged helix-turn-helix transcriptional regulator [Candidatus Nomurabacteria bacterium]HRV76065.1 winged helix-turn-helix domain-containing protein [Candidatus Saccharimonadales bacterium]
MVDQLFGSKTRVKLLKFFFANQDEEFFVRELTRLLDEQINSIRRELINLADAGVVKSIDKENKVYYRLNKEGDLYEGLDKILAPRVEATSGDAKEVKAGKVVGVAGEKKGIVVKDAKLKLVKDEIGALEGIKLVSVSGSLLKNAPRGVDLVAVGDLSDKDEVKFKEVVSGIETKLNKSLNYVLFSEEDYRYRLKINDRFIISFLQGKHEVLLDELK